MLMGSNTPPADVSVAGPAAPGEIGRVAARTAQADGDRTTAKSQLRTEEHRRAIASLRTTGGAVKPTFKGYHGRNVPAASDARPGAAVVS